MAGPGSHRIIRLSETGSTNQDALRLATQGEALPLWVVAERQTGGRGRQGRAWQSVIGNLHASLAIQSSVAPADAGQIALVAGVAFYDAVASTTALGGHGLRLKWPNDLLVGTAKIGGILVESVTSWRPPATLISVIGFGLNIVAAPELDRPVAALADFDAGVSDEIVLAALADSCETWLDRWGQGRGFSHIRAAWVERAGAAGEPISIHTGSGRVSGTYQGLSATGALLMDVEGRLEEFNFGDVALGA